MAQHDYNIANAGGAAVRADINAALQALLTTNSGPAAPSPTAPFMMWFDTANTRLMIRNAGDTAWLEYTQALASIAEAQAGTNAVNAITPATLKAAQIRLATSVASTSGTAIDFTGIPTWARRVTVMLVEVSTSGTSQVQIQVGAGSVATSGYVGVTDTQSTAGGSTAAPTSGLVLERSGIGGATINRTGVAVFSKVTGNRWVGTYTGAFIAGSAFIAWASATINLGADLDRVRLTTVGGTDTFDAGTVNISWE